MISPAITPCRIWNDEMQKPSRVGGCRGDELTSVRWGGFCAAPSQTLLIGRPVGRLELNSLLTDGDHFILGEQTLQLNVTNAFG
jgi:hypothetical protein